MLLSIAMGAAGVSFLMMPAVRGKAGQLSDPSWNEARELAPLATHPASVGSVPRGVGSAIVDSSRFARSGSGVSLEEQEALVALEAGKGQWATRIRVDRARQLLTISREVAYGAGCVATDADDECFVLDCVDVEQRETFEREFAFDGVQVRIMLMRYGPFGFGDSESAVDSESSVDSETSMETEELVPQAGREAEGLERRPDLRSVPRFVPRPSTGATRIYLWIEGRCRAEGLLEGSILSMTGVESFTRLSVHFGPSLLWSTVIRGESEIQEMVQRGADFLSPTPWVMTPGWCFEQAELEQLLDREVGDSPAEPAGAGLSTDA